MSDIVRYLPAFPYRITLLLAVLLALIAHDAHALKLTDTAPDGTTTTYEVSDSLGVPIFRAITNPVVVTDGTTATAKNVLALTDRAGNVFTMGPAGEVYRNGIRLTSTSSTGALQKMLAQKLVLFGTEIYAKGKTDNRWWRWTGSATVNAWAPVTVDYDAKVLD